MAPATTSVPRTIAWVTGLVTAAPRLAFSVRRVLRALLRFDAVFAALLLREALARFEAVFVARAAAFAAVRPRALPTPALARDLDAVFAPVPLRAATVLDTVFLEAANSFFLGPPIFFAAGRPRDLIPPVDLEAAFFDDLAMQNSFELMNVAPGLSPPDAPSVVEN
jgi:hypothetical protein